MMHREFAAARMSAAERDARQARLLAGLRWQRRAEVASRRARRALAGS
ncbi:MAG: hypothetical protein M3P91_10595 [Actinomycetota bacterium]|nr:hypothetical protein [Actinomycetota bacterium]